MYDHIVILLPIHIYTVFILLPREKKKKEKKPTVQESCMGFRLDSIYYLTEEREYLTHRIEANGNEMALIH